VAGFFVIARNFFAHCIDTSNPGAVLLAVGFQFFLIPFSMAGPPLVTDDPGILEPGTWEFIVAVASEDRKAGRVTQAPSLDVSLGMTKNTQISFFLPRTVISAGKAEEKTGLDFATVGYKWRFASGHRWEWAIASNYTLPVSHEILEHDGSDDIRVLNLPLLASFSQGYWTWQGQLGLNVGSDGSRFWDYGLAVSRQLGNSMQWMMEVFGGAALSFEHRTLNYQLGLDYEINPDLHLLTAVGSRIKSGPEPDNRLNLSFYIGLQWFH
jgi:hypothetical protein